MPSHPRNRQPRRLDHRLRRLVISTETTATLDADRYSQQTLHKSQDCNGPDIFGYSPERAPFTQFTSPEMLLPIALAAVWIGVITIR